MKRVILFILFITHINCSSTFSSKTLKNSSQFKAHSQENTFAENHSKVIRPKTVLVSYYLITKDQDLNTFKKLIQATTRIKDSGTRLSLKFNQRLSLTGPSALSKFLSIEPIAKRPRLLSNISLPSLGPADTHLESLNIIDEIFNSKYDTIEIPKSSTIKTTAPISETSQYPSKPKMTIELKIPNGKKVSMNLVDSIDDIEVGNWSQAYAYVTEIQMQKLIEYHKNSNTKFGIAPLQQAKPEGLYYVRIFRKNDVRVFQSLGGLTPGKSGKIMFNIDNPEHLFLRDYIDSIFTASLSNNPQSVGIDELFQEGIFLGKGSFGEARICKDHQGHQFVLKKVKIRVFPKLKCA